MSGARSQGQKVSRPAARYRPGKVPQLPPSASAGTAKRTSRIAAPPPPPPESDSEADEEEEREEQRRRDVAITDVVAGTEALRSGADRETAGIVIQEGQSTKVDIQFRKPGQASAPQGADDDSSEYETDTDDEPPTAALSKPVFRKPGAAAPAPKEESSEYETDSEEEESEEEGPQPVPAAKPMFVPKRLRETLKDDGLLPKTEEELDAKAQAEGAARRKAAHDLAAERIKAELLVKSHDEAQPDLDDTDGKEPEAEFQAWRLRELQRIERTKNAEREREEEKREIERRREMPEEQRMKEDMARAKKTREEKKKGNIGFMQKYYHKGAFFQDLDILKRDYSGMTEDAVDKSTLPKLLQVRDFGKAGRSKWTHLAAEDTSRAQGGDARLRFANKERNQSAGGPPGAGAGSGPGCFICGGPHLKRECPNFGPGSAGAGHGRDSAEGRSKTGTNTIESRRPEREWGAQSGPSSGSRHRNDGPPDRYR